MLSYKEEAIKIRKQVLTLIHRGGTSHIASCFSAVDIATVLYRNVKKEDEIVWSCAWKAALIYTMLARQGKITKKQLESFPNPPFLGLAETSVPGVHVSGGSMGQGLGVAIGMALGKKRAKEKGTIYCILSDGEHQEGSIWEGILVAQQHKLNNLVVLVDYNKWTAMGRTKDVSNLEPFSSKWSSFGWQTQRIDGHDCGEIELALSVLRKKPYVIICDTIKGKGVKEFENKILYHYSSVDKPTYEMALAELK
jgi:transketolase